MKWFTCIMMVAGSGERAVRATECADLNGCRAHSADSGGGFL